MKLEDMEEIIQNYDSFARYVSEQDTHVENATVELIGIAYKLDGEELPDYHLINIIESILDLHSAYMRRNQL
jgi:UDP-N-acetyl-D-mannosaminuronate dehydrogenase